MKKERHNMAYICNVCHNVYHRVAKLMGGVCPANGCLHPLEEVHDLLVGSRQTMKSHDPKHVAIALELNGRFFTGFDRKDRVRTAWTIAGARLFRTGINQALEEAERRLTEKGKKFQRRQFFTDKILTINPRPADPPCIPHLPPAQ
jgi:hypothetical protein